MAEFRRVDGTRSCRLMTEHLVGRGAQCALRLAAGYVSTQHALIRWDGRAWEVLDRGSRNGTQLNGVAIEPGRPCRLLKGDVVTFGHADERWVLSDPTEPQTMALALDDGQTLLGAQGIIGLPSSANPECTLFQEQDGTWKVEHENGVVETLVDGQVLDAGGRRFRFCCVTSSSATETLSMHEGETPTLCFSVSSDEDFVELSHEVVVAA